MPDFLPAHLLAALQEQHLAARSGVDDDDSDDEWEGITDEERRRYLADEEARGN